MKKAKVQTFDDSLKLVWHFADDTTESIEINDFSEEIMNQATMHGLKQKLSDCYAGATTVREAKEKFYAVLETLRNGDWNAKRITTGGLWVEALARAAQVTIEQALEKWNSLDDDQIKDLKKHPGIKQAKAEIELERAKEKAEGSELDLSAL